MTDFPLVWFMHVFFPTSTLFEFGSHMNFVSFVIHWNLTSLPYVDLRSELAQITVHIESILALKNSVVQWDESKQTPQAPLRRVPKTVRFRAQVHNTPERDNQNIQTIQTSRPNVTNRSRTGIIPLGRAQYSAQTLSTESLNVDQVGFVVVYSRSSKWLCCLSVTMTTG